MSLVFHLSEMRSIVSASKNDFGLLYINVVEKAKNILEKNESHNKNEKIFFVLDNIISTLKIRRAFMLPIGSDTETCYQQHDVWSYALFTAVLIKTVSAEVNHQKLIELAEQLIPQTGLNWLKKYDQVFTSWCDYLNGNADANNSIVIVINQANNLTENL